MRLDAGKITGNFVGWAKAPLRAVPTILAQDDPSCPDTSEPRSKGACFSSRSFSPIDRATCWWSRLIVCEAPIEPFNNVARLETIAICVLPDHIHAVWALPEGDADFSTRWNLIKTGFSRGRDPMPRSASKAHKREKGIWQRRYWEHTIRDDADLERHVDYIHFNPVKHGHVTRVVDWPHSSFHRYVERGQLASDWGGDIKDIQGAFLTPSQPVEITVESF
jgi:putative transposase